MDGKSVIRQVVGRQITSLANNASVVLTPVKAPRGSRTIDAFIYDNTKDLRVTLENFGVGVDNSNILQRYSTLTQNRTLQLMRKTVELSELQSTVVNRTGSSFTGSIGFAFGTGERLPDLYPVKATTSYDVDAVASVNEQAISVPSWARRLVGITYNNTSVAFTFSLFSQNESENIVQNVGNVSPGLILYLNRPINPASQMQLSLTAAAPITTSISFLWGE